MRRYPPPHPPPPTNENNGRTFSVLRGADDSIYVIFGCSLWKYNETSSWILLIDSNIFQTKGLSCPSGMAVDANENIYFVDDQSLYYVDKNNRGDPAKFENLFSLNNTPKDCGNGPIKKTFHSSVSDNFLKTSLSTSCPGTMTGQIALWDKCHEGGKFVLAFVQSIGGSYQIMRVEKSCPKK